MKRRRTLSGLVTATLVAGGLMGCGGTPVGSAEPGIPVSARSVDSRARFPLTRHEFRMLQRSTRSFAGAADGFVRALLTPCARDRSCITAAYGRVQRSRHAALGSYGRLAGHAGGGCRGSVLVLSLRLERLAGALTALDAVRMRDSSRDYAVQALDAYAACQPASSPAL